MIARYLSSIEGIGLIGVISLLLSVLSFLAIAVWTWRADHGYLRHMAQLPLESTDPLPDTLEKARQ